MHAARPLESGPCTGEEEITGEGYHSRNELRSRGRPDTANEQSPRRSLSLPSACGHSPGGGGGIKKPVVREKTVSGLIRRMRGWADKAP